MVRAMAGVFRIALFLCCLQGIAQSKQVDKIIVSPAKLAKAARVSGLMAAQQGSCAITSYHFSANLGNSVKSMDVKGDTLPATVKSVLQALKAGDRFLIENIRYNCADDLKKSYLFIIR